MLTDSPLGKTSTYITQYAPELLFPVPRTLARNKIHLQAPFPFKGVDIWNAYELSWLNPQGKPQIAMLEIVTPCTSTNIVESKSLKLYLNSFNQSKFDTAEEVRKLIESDLSRCANGEVKVSLVSPLSQIGHPLIEFSGLCIDDLDVETDAYEIHPAFLKASDKHVEETLYSQLLKSNCLATGQPDWATVLIHYKGPQIDREGLLKYVISYRNHTGFHEDCVEQMFVDILKICRPEKLTVYARYTRRGGLDINPFRSNFEALPTNQRHVRQ